jgi:hypothetical protein
MTSFVVAKVSTNKLRCTLTVVYISAKSLSYINTVERDATKHCVPARLILKPSFVPHSENETSSKLATSQTVVEKHPIHLLRYLFKAKFYNNYNSHKHGLTRQLVCALAYQTTPPASADIQIHSNPPIMTSSSTTLTVDHDDHLFCVDYTLAVPEYMVAAVNVTLTSLVNVHSSLAVVQRAISVSKHQESSVTFDEVSEPWACPEVS